jgi:hypothetical protein
MQSIQGAIAAIAVLEGVRMHRSHRALFLAIFLVASIPCGQIHAATPSYVQFFTAINDSYVAYLDTVNQTIDGQGYKLFSVKLAQFSTPFRDWIKKNFPGAETAEYAIDPYSIDCVHKTIGEHRLVWYDSNGFPMGDYDFGGKMAPPNADTMKDHLMQKVCGF